MSASETVTEGASGARPRKTTRYLFIALGITVYLIAVSLIGWRKVADSLAGANIPLVIAAAALTCTGALLRMWKWRRALGAERQAIGLYFLSRSGGVWSPARVGEFLPLLWRRHRSASVAAWILFDRVIEILVTLALGIVGLAFIQLVSPGSLAGIAAAVTLSSVIGVYLLTRADWLDALAARFDQTSRTRRALHAIANTSGELRRFARRSPDLLALTVIGKACDLYAVALIFRALGHPVGFALAAASKCALAIVSYLPITPITTGVPHTVQGWIMHESAGVMPETVAASVAIEAGIMMVVFALMALVAARAIRDAAL